MKNAPTVVFATEFWPGATGYGVSKGLRDLGWAVQEVDKLYCLPSPQDGRLMSRVATRILRIINASVYERVILEQCSIMRPDFFLTVKGMDISQRTLQLIKSMGIRTAMYYPDFTFDLHGVEIDAFAYYDVFITTKTFQVDELKLRLPLSEVTYIPHGYSENVHRPYYDQLSEKDYVFDCLYSGNFCPYKADWLRRLVKVAPSLSINIQGGTWQQNLTEELLKQVTSMGPRKGVSYAQNIQRSRINLAMHAGPTTSDWQDNVSTRSFEIPACRGFMLHIDNDEIRDFYKVGEEIDVFRDPGELSDKIKFYLHRPELRMRMISRAYDRCVPAYSYTSRALDISKILLNL